MESSNYRQVLEIVELKTEIDNQGIETTEIIPLFKFRAYVNNLVGKEYWKAKSLNLEETIKIYTFYCNQLITLNTKIHFIKFNEKLYNITQIDNIKYLNREIQIKAFLKQ